MAFNAQQIYPIDFNKSAAVGIDIPFNAPSVFRPNYTTKAAIKNHLINYFLTNFFPNVNVNNLEILKQEDLNTITVLLSYNVINTNINDTLEIDFT